MRSWCAVGVALLCLTTCLQAEDWPQFRGPTGQGVANGSLPTEWSPKSNVFWKTPTPSGWSSPVIQGGKIYITGSVPVPDKGKDLSLRTMCLDAATGKVEWDNEIFKQDGGTAPNIHRKNSHASPTPILDGNRLFVHFGHQGTALLDLKGKILWKTNDIKYKPVHGNGGTPVLVGSSLIFSCDGSEKPFVVALNADTGKLLWKTDRPKVDQGQKFAFSTPLVIEVNGKTQVISPAAGMVGAYDPKTGTEIWRVRYPTGYSVIPRPVHAHGLVFLSSGYNTPVLYAIKPDGKGDVTDTHVAWQMKKGAPHTPSALVVGNDLYMVSDGGIASCLDAKSGKVHWQERIGGAYSASPLLADGKVYFQSEEGEAVVVKADQKFEVLARNNLGEKALASYAVADGALYIRTEKHLYRIQSGTTGQ